MHFHYRLFSLMKINEIVKRSQIGIYLFKKQSQQENILDNDVLPRKPHG